MDVHALAGGTAAAPRRLRWALLAGLTAVLYFATAKASLVFAIPPGYASAVWPPAGIAAAALILAGRNLWPGVWLGLTAANLTVQPSLAAPFALGVGGALEALFIAWGVQRFIGAPVALFSSPARVFRFAGLALVGGAISASIANLTLAAAGTVSAESWALNWLTWWLGDAMGVLLVTPLVLAVAAGRARVFGPGQFVEFVLAMALLVATTAVVFFDTPLGLHRQPLMFILLPPIAWIAARFEAREVTLASFACSALAMFATVLGEGPFVSGSLNTSLLLQQAFVCTIAVVALALCVSVNELRRAHRELEVLVNLASHDLQEPVRNTLGYADLLQRRYGSRLDDDAHEFIGFIVAGAQRMRKLIDDLLALSRATRSQLVMRPVESGAALDSALEALGPALAEASAELTRDPLPQVLGERTLIEQLFQNLVGNALKFRGAAPARIHVSARRQGTGWLFAVADQGIGIAPRDHERIFHMFERLQSRTRGGGAGMGLALCRRIVERHGGRLWVESEPMHGATFYFTLAGADAARP